MAKAASKPTIFTIDDDAEVLRAVERDLKQKYGAAYRILSADSGAGALELTKQLHLRNEEVALFLVDQRMPNMTGTEFLTEAKEIFPNAKRVLLTAYADTESAIHAINNVRVDYYLSKPWSPPSEKLYPVLDDLLRYWRPANGGLEDVRVVGHRWSPDSHRIKDFLARNQVPYSWIDVENAATDEATAGVLEAIAEKLPTLPVVLFGDGSCAQNPTNTAVAEKVGLHTRAERPFYDIIIVGAGPAGLAAAVYAASEGLKTVLIEREAAGGQAGQSSRIENYLGFPDGLSGAELAKRAIDQARRFNVEILSPVEVESVRVENSYRLVRLSDGCELSCHALLIATGVAYRKLEAPGLDKLTGAGVYYGAAMTEAISCKDQDVYLIGGANSAGQAAMYFSQYANSVTMLVRGDSLSKSMSQYLIDQIEHTDNIHVRTCTRLIEVQGEESLKSLTIHDDNTGRRETVPASALFIFIGAKPCTEWLGNVVERDEFGFIMAGSDLQRDGKMPSSWTLDRDPYLLETSVPGIFVAGDVRHGSVKRCAAGVGEGSISISFVHQYLSKVQ